MALIKCHECGKDVSTQAKECPNCGALVQYSNRIKWYYWVPVLLLVIIAYIYYSDYPNIIKKELSSKVPDYSTGSEDTSTKIQTQATESKPKSAEEIRSGIKTYCANKWPDNYGMQEHCNKSQIESYNNLVQINNNNPKNSEAQKILNRCLHKWKKGDGYNYDMAEYCTNSEIESYNRLNN
ncbi:MAG: zinc-ribbon domain-containing protein [Thermodesulfobacteriota bacterium]